MAAKPQTPKEDQEQRDKINRMDFTITDVVLPALKTIQVDLKTVVQKDFITRAEADSKYANVDTVKFLKNVVYSLGAAFAAYVMYTTLGAPK